MKKRTFLTVVLLAVLFTSFAAPTGVDAAVTITEYATPTQNSDPQGITAGPDGNLWFTEYNVNKIGKTTPAGTITEYPIPTAASGPLIITAGPDGNLWFTEANVNKIGKITPTGTITERENMGSNLHC
jgi:virginiamycin B lyase